MLARAPIISATASPAVHLGPESLADNHFGGASQHIHLAPVPVMYVPGVYPVYSEFPHLPQHSSEQEPTSQDGHLSPRSSSGDCGHATEVSTEPGVPESRGVGLRYPRYSKRVQSKSDPSGSGTTSEGL